MSYTPLNRGFAPKCSCGSTQFKNLQRVIIVCSVDDWGYRDGRLFSISNGSAETDWDTAEDEARPYMCAECGKRYTEAKLFALCTPEQVAEIMKEKLTT
jgi:hypothetical protein